MLINLKNAQDVSRYERGKVEVPDFRIDLIAKATKRPRSYFVRDSSEPEPVNGLGERLGRLEAGVEANRVLLVEIATVLGVPVHDEPPPAVDDQQAV